MSVITVTDAIFQQEALEASKTKPVLVEISTRGNRIPGQVGNIKGPSEGEALFWVQNRKYRCAIGSTSAGSHHSNTPSALT